MRTVPHLVIVSADGKTFIHSNEGDDVPDFTIPVPEEAEDAAETIVARSNAAPGAIAAMDVVVRMLERSVEFEDTPEWFEPKMLDGLKSALSDLRGR